MKSGGEMFAALEISHLKRTSIQASVPVSFARPLRLYHHDVCSARQHQVPEDRGAACPDPATHLPEYSKCDLSEKDAWAAAGLVSRRENR